MMTPLAGRSPRRRRDDKVFQVPNTSTTAALVGGVPIAVATIWYIENFMLPAGYEIDATVAVALGSIGTVIFGELAKVAKRLLDRIAPPTDPPPGS